MRKTLSNSKCFVVILKRTTKDTAVVTRTTNNCAPNKPCLVMMILNPPSFMLSSASPGVKTLNNAGTAIKRENSGMNIKDRLRKKFRLMLEQYDKSKHSAYSPSKTKIFFVRRTETIKRRNVIVFIQGSIDCNSPFFNAYSSAKTDS